MLRHRHASHNLATWSGHPGGMVSPGSLHNQERAACFGPQVRDFPLFAGAKAEGEPFAELKIDAVALQPYRAFVGEKLPGCSHGRIAFQASQSVLVLG